MVDVTKAKMLRNTGEGSYLRQQFPSLYGALGGMLGTSPDDMQGSVLDPNTAAVRAGADATSNRFSIFCTRIERLLWAYSTLIKLLWRR